MHSPISPACCNRRNATASPCSLTSGRSRSGATFPSSSGSRARSRSTSSPRIADAEASLREAARLEPDNMRIQLDIGALCIVQGKFDEADAPLARALELDPDNPYAAVMLTFGRMQRCAWQGLERALRPAAPAAFRAPSRAQHNAVPFPLLAMPLGPELELAAARRYAQQIAAADHGGALAGRRRGAQARLAPAGGLRFLRLPRSPGRRYCCSNAGSESIASRIETFAYGLLPPDRSPLGQRIVSAFDHFVEVYEETAEQTARRIRADGVQVLIDLNGYTTHARSEIFALKPAPVQISWLGYLGTLGAPWYDYVLTDRFACAGRAAALLQRALSVPARLLLSERHPARGGCGDAEPRGLRAARARAGVLLLQQQLQDPARGLCAVAAAARGHARERAVAGSRQRHCRRRNLRREAAARGLDPQRLVLAPRVSLPEHLARHAHADLFLDTTPYNAGTTANDALFMGVPVLTCAGATMVSRVAGSQLQRRRAAGVGHRQPRRVRSPRAASSPPSPRCSRATAATSPRSARARPCSTWPASPTPSMTSSSPHGKIGARWRSSEHSIRHGISLVTQRALSLRQRQALQGLPRARRCRSAAGPRCRRAAAQSPGCFRRRARAQRRKRACGACSHSPPITSGPGISSVKFCVRAILRRPTRRGGTRSISTRTMRKRRFISAIAIASSANTLPP